MIARRLFLAVFALVGLGVAACAKDAPPQPLAFSHAVHAGKHAIACESCHAGSETGAEAMLPAVRDCLRCHMRPQGDVPSPREAQVRALAKTDGLRWIQVTRNPGHVYFSHRAHVRGADMKCSDCHGDVTRWAEPPRSPNPNLTDMDACMGCHRRRGASNECQTCHR